MGMKLIKNLSPNNVTVNIMVINNGQNVNFTLEYGDSVLVNDVGAVTKSVIIQTKKRNIQLFDEFPTGMIAYKKYSVNDNPATNNAIEDDLSILDKNEAQIIPVSSSNSGQMEPISNTNVSSKNAEQKNKGGRPKGALNKKKKKKKTSKTNKNTVFISPDITTRESD